MNLGFGDVPCVHLNHRNALLFLPVSNTVTLPKPANLPNTVTFGDGLDTCYSSDYFHSSGALYLILELFREG